ncbi:MAG: hypothetical protein M1818_003073 [Claussenomyces sp. TS43310]|nr:MAG: hypothetical protein M1818_003073 [Claussenomyces sp. TS43310]
MAVSRNLAAIEGCFGNYKLSQTDRANLENRLNAYAQQHGVEDLDLAVATDKVLYVHQGLLTQKSTTFASRDKDVFLAGLEVAIREMGALSVAHLHILGYIYGAVPGFMSITEEILDDAEADGHEFQQWIIACVETHQLAAYFGFGELESDIERAVTTLFAEVGMTRERLEAAWFTEEHIEYVSIFGGYQL